MLIVRTLNNKLVALSADVIGGNSQNAWLIEILTGEDLDPQRNFEGLDHSQVLDEDSTQYQVLGEGFYPKSSFRVRILPQIKFVMEDSTQHRVCDGGFTQLRRFRGVQCRF